jgi:DNA-binding protein H-NS
VPNHTKRFIEQINDVSRQLLSRILAMQKDIQLLPQKLALEVTETQLTDKKNKELSKLMDQRQKLISTLFKQNSVEDISAQPKLLQEMISLDNELTANAELSQKAVSNQIIEIKKSKKIIRNYQKY